jgi:hypothetical protein
MGGTEVTIGLAVSVVVSVALGSLLGGLGASK